jgi:hypothetical protein
VNPVDAPGQNQEIVVFIVHRDSECSDFLAVQAHVRHAHTNYDELLFRCGDSDLAPLEWAGPFLPDVS